MTGARPALETRASVSPGQSVQGGEVQYKEVVPKASEPAVSSPPRTVGEPSPTTPVTSPTRATLPPTPPPTLAAGPFRSPTPTSA